jgi:pyridoxine 5-phosphate synthase
MTLRLGVNIDHVATLRNARGGRSPDPLRAAAIATEAGADGITAHLREDRRHISDDDIARLVETLTLPLNLEMAATEEMVAIACRHRPHAACLVPERRQELTTEGGLDVIAGGLALQGAVDRLKRAGIRVSLFIDARAEQIERAAAIGTDVVELHTGRYCEAEGAQREAELARLAEGARLAHSLGLEVHAGHGLALDTVGPVAAIPELVELNIGHAIIADAVFVGLGRAVADMKAAMQAARA